MTTANPEEVREQCAREILAELEDAKTDIDARWRTKNWPNGLEDMAKWYLTSRQPATSATMTEEDQVLLDALRARSQNTDDALGGYSKQIVNLIDRLLSSAPVAAQTPKYADVSCSQCGASFGPGEHGFSHCDQHQPPERWIPDLIRNQYDKAPAHYSSLDTWDDGADDIARKIIERLKAKSASTPQAAGKMPSVEQIVEVIDSTATIYDGPSGVGIGSTKEVAKAIAQLLHGDKVG